MENQVKFNIVVVMLAGEAGDKEKQKEKDREKDRESVRYAEMFLGEAT